MPLHNPRPVTRTTVVCAGNIFCFHLYIINMNLINGRYFVEFQDTPQWSYSANRSLHSQGSIKIPKCRKESTGQAQEWMPLTEVAATKLPEKQLRICVKANDNLLCTINALNSLFYHVCVPMSGLLKVTGFESYYWIWAFCPKLAILPQIQEYSPNQNTPERLWNGQKP